MTQNIIRYQHNRTSPESRQREPNQTNETKIFSLSFIHLGKWSNIAYLWVAKVCASLGLAVHLKVKFESICAEVFSVQWLSNVSTWPVLFKEQGSIKVCSCLWKWIMSRTKEITEDLGKRVDVAHQARKGYKTISKEFGLHKSTVRQIQDHCYLPEKWSTNKDHSKAERVIVCEVAKVPRVTSKQLKVFLTLANVNVHESTIRRTLSKHGVHGRAARRKPPFSKKKIAC